MGDPDRGLGSDDKVTAPLFKFLVTTYVVAKLCVSGSVVMKCIYVDSQSLHLQGPGYHLSKANAFEQDILACIIAAILIRYLYR